MTRWGHIFNVIYDIGGRKSEHLNCLIPSAWILIYNAYYEMTKARAFYNFAFVQKKKFVPVRDVTHRETLKIAVNQLEAGRKKKMCKNFVQK